MRKIRKFIKQATDRLDYYAIVIVVTSFVVLTGCEEKSPVPRDFPQLNTLEVANITSSGALFQAELTSMGTEPIVEMGFVWGQFGASLFSDDKKEVDITASTGIFSAEIKAYLAKNTKYYVKAYVKTASLTVYGKSVEFVSLGSLAPEITGFEPKSAGWLDVITIRGRYFSPKIYNNDVKFNNIYCKVQSATDTTLTVIVDRTITQPTSNISVKVAGNITVYTSDVFRFIPPSVTDFYPKKAKWGDTIKITGSYLRNFVGIDIVKIGNVGCTPVYQDGNSLLIIKVPYSINTLNSFLTVNMSGFVMMPSQQFELLTPGPFTFTPLTGTWGSTVTLTGQFNATTASNKVFFNSFEGTIVTSNSTSITVKVPDALNVYNPDIIYKSDPFQVVSTGKFLLTPPLLKSFSPVSGAGSTTVTIKGKYFGKINTPVVKFGTVAASVTSFNDSTIVTNVPQLGNGPCRISVIIAGKEIAFSSDYFVTNPHQSGLA